MFNNISDKSNVYQAIIDACSYLLRSDENAESCRNYIDSRLTKDQQEKYGVGYFPTSSNLQTLIGFVGKEFLETYNIIYYKQMMFGSMPIGHFEKHPLIMPFRNVHGEIVSILGRSILSEAEQKENKIQKYKYTLNADKDLYVYGLDLAKPSIIEKDYVICVEGQFDCIACHNLGINNVVALGWATLSKYQVFQISKYTNNIILMFDNDDAGRNGAKKAKAKYGNVLNIKIMYPPKGYKDIDEFFRSDDLEKKEDAINLLKNLL